MAVVLVGYHYYWPPYRTYGRRASAVSCDVVATPSREGTDSHTSRRVELLHRTAKRYAYYCSEWQVTGTCC